MSGSAPALSTLADTSETHPEFEALPKAATSIPLTREERVDQLRASDRWQDILRDPEHCDRMIDSRLPRYIDVFRDPEPIITVLEEIEQAAPQLLECVTLRCRTGSEEYISQTYDPDDRNAVNGYVSELDVEYTWDDVSLGEILSLARNELTRRRTASGSHTLDSCEGRECLLTARWSTDEAGSSWVFGPTPLSPARRTVLKTAYMNAPLTAGGTVHEQLIADGFGPAIVVEIWVDERDGRSTCTTSSIASLPQVVSRLSKMPDVAGLRLGRIYDTVEDQRARLIESQHDTLVGILEQRGLPPELLSRKRLSDWSVLDGLSAASATGVRSVRTTATVLTPSENLRRLMDLSDVLQQLGKTLQDCRSEIRSAIDATQALQKRMGS